MKNYKTPEQRREYMKKYMRMYTKKHDVVNTPLRRARKLLFSYNREDRKYDRGEGNLTPEWIADNILTKPCVHCGKTGWKVVGCNRLDNSKPHTMDNVEPCCLECNHKLRGKDMKNGIGVKKEGIGKKVYQYDSKTMELIGVWNCIINAGKDLGASTITIRKYCTNGTSFKGYILSFKPL